MKQENVRVGVGVLVLATPSNSGGVNNEQAQPMVYAGIRKGSHGAGSLALPGGHLEMMENWEDCAKREVKEEMDLELTNLRFVHVSNDIMTDEEKHYVTIFMMGDIKNTQDQIPKNMEPHKCEGWNCYSWDQLKEIRNVGSPVLFGPLAKFIDEAPASVIRVLKE